MCILGEFAKGLIVSGGLACIGLLGPSGTLCSNILAYLRQLAGLGDSWPG